MTGSLSQCPTLTLRREKHDHGEIFPEQHSGEVLSIDENYMQVGLIDLSKGKVVFPLRLVMEQVRSTRHCDLDYLLLMLATIFFFFWKVIYMYLCSSLTHICFGELCNILKHCHTHNVIIIHCNMIIAYCVCYKISGAYNQGQV